MATNNMNNLTTLIKRLEAATSRLEDIASSAASFEVTDPPPGPSPSTASAVVSDSSAKKGQPSPSPSSQSAASEPAAPKTVALFDTLINDDLKPWLELSRKIGGLVQDQAAGVEKAFQEQREFILLTTKAKNPGQDSATYMECIVGMQSQIIKVDGMVSKNYGSPLRDHLAMVAGGLQCLSWVTLDSKPHELISELFGGAQMYGNKILKKYKDEDPTQVKWVQTFYKLFKTLQEYVKTNFPKGMTWNPSGIEASEALKQAKVSPSGSKAGGSPAPPPPPAGGAPPAPPPPAPAPPPVVGDINKSPASGGDMGAVFQDLNKGEAITSGLRKVDASQQTHKNPSLRAAAPMRSGSSSSAGRGKSPTPPTKPKPESMRTKKPPRKELDGNKWIIENFDSPNAPVEIEVEINHSILISRCKNTTIRVRGKANAISADSSTRLCIIIDSLVSSIDVIKCPNFAVQILDSVPTIMLDQVDGATVYLSKDSTGTEIFSSKCSAVNINVLAGGEDDMDYKECAVPEQMRSYVKDGKLVTEIVEHAG